MLLVVHGVAIWQRKALIGMPFLLIWGVFGLVAGGATLMTWVLVSFLQETLVNPAQAVQPVPAGIHLLSSAGFMFAWIERRLLPTD